MNQDRKFNLYKLAVIIVGGCCVVFAIFNLNYRALDWKVFLFLAFALFISSKLTLAVPHTKSHLSFADTMIFLIFILFGGEAAIIFGTLEMLVNCLFLKHYGVSFGKLTISFNVFSTSLSTAVTYLALATVPRVLGFEFDYANTRSLITGLGLLALSQFLATSVLAAVYHSFRFPTGFWDSWKKFCFSSSMTQIVGAGLAGVAYKIFDSGDLLTSSMALIVFGVTYAYYRQSINEVNQSVTEAEKAQREKAETEMARRVEAERYAGELSLSLQKEEETSEALRQSTDALEHAAFHDFLTDLPNRSYLVERLGLLLEIGIESTSKYFVLFLDLSRFKNINDRLGHTVGDRVLKLVGKRLVRLLREEDTIARLGGDEFAIVLTNVSSIKKAEEIARLIHEKLSQPFYLQGQKIFSDLHIGIAPFTSEHIEPEDILRDADIAMHQAKVDGSGVAVFTREMRELFLDKITLEADLRFAVERRELLMHYQPIVSLANGELLGFESLLRWQHPKRGLISPDKFIPIAEDTGLIVPMTRWILNESCGQIAEWQKISDRYRDLTVSVNISGKHLSDDSLINDVTESLIRAHLAPASLKLEITESIAMENAEQTIRILNKLKDLHVRLSIDDFGTGYSSLNYLHRLPFDTLKIDRSFVQGVGEHGENSEILRTIISLAQNLRMRVIAEGIENRSQLKLLQEMGCDYGQGYLMSRPLPKAQAEIAMHVKKDWLSLESEEPSGNMPKRNERDEIIGIFN